MGAFLFQGGEKLDKGKNNLEQQKFHLKAMVSTKQVEDITDDDMVLINKHTRREFTADEVYIYPIVLCDNESDRDYEYFTKKDLDILSDLFIGKTFIQDHTWSSENQHSRIFKSEVVKVPGKTVENDTRLKGKPYYQLKAWAYTVKKGHEHLIENIEAGILKEVSVGFRIEDMECDICGNSFYDGSKCSHYPGKEYEYNGVKQVCYLHMKNPTEAFEVSFVAVPAQPAAGVIKGIKIEGLKKGFKDNIKHAKTERSIFYAKLNKRGEISMEKLKELVIKAKSSESDVVEIPVSDLEKDLGIYDEAIVKATKAEDKLKELEPKAKMGEAYIDDLKKECNRLGKMAEGKSFNEEVMKSIFDKCNLEELKAFKKQYEDKVDELYPPQPQVKSNEGQINTIVDNSDFK